MSFRCSVLDFASFLYCNVCWLVVLWMVVSMWFVWHLLLPRHSLSDKRIALRLQVRIRLLAGLLSFHFLVFVFCYCSAEIGVGSLASECLFSKHVLLPKQKVVAIFAAQHCDLGPGGSFLAPRRTILVPRGNPGRPREQQCFQVTFCIDFWIEIGILGAPETRFSNTRYCRKQLSTGIECMNFHGFPGWPEGPPSWEHVHRGR